MPAFHKAYRSWEIFMDMERKPGARGGGAVGHLGKSVTGGEGPSKGKIKKLIVVITTTTKVWECGKVPPGSFPYFHTLF